MEVVPHAQVDCLLACTDQYIKNKTFFSVYQIFSCVSAVLKTDKSAEVRRAAVLVITLILRGLGKNIMEVSLFTSQSEDLVFQPIRGPHLHDLSHTYLHGPCTILCTCGFLAQ